MKKITSRNNLACGILLTLSVLPSAALSQTVFVPEGSANSVLVVDGNTGATIRRIEGLEAVHGLSGASGVPVLVAGSYATIAQGEAAATETPEGVQPDEHAVHHAPAKRPVDPAQARISLLSILDAKTGEILRRVEVYGAVHHTAVSPDGSFAVATHPDRDGISVVNLSTYDGTAQIPTGLMPNYAVFGADPRIVFVSNAGNGTVSEVDLTRGIVKRNLIAGEAPEHLAIDTAGSRLYVADANAGKILELALDSGETLRRFDIGGEIHGLGLTGDGTRLIVAGRGEDKLASVNLADGAITVAELGPQPYHLTTIPGTDRIFVSSRAEPKVWIVNAGDMTVTGEFTIKGEGHQMVVVE